MFQIFSEEHFFNSNFVYALLDAIKYWIDHMLISELGGNGHWSICP